MTIRVALIGTGVMGMDHAKLFAHSLPNVTLDTICDVSQERARAVADQLGVRNVLTDPMAAAQAPAIDGVVIASPDETHASLSIAAIKAGKHVLCEKPLSQSAQECIEVMELEQSIGKCRVQIGFMRRFDPSYVEMKYALEGGVVGQPIMLHCFHRNMTAPANFVGQMAVTNSAPHEYDAARYLLGEEMVAISVYQPRAELAKGTARPVFMVIETASGRLVNVEINNNAGYGYDVRAELVGESGSIFLRSPAHSELFVKQRAETTIPADWRPRFAEAYRQQNLAWLQAIAQDKPSPIASNAWDAYCASRIAEEGVKALVSGQRTPIDLIAKPKLYQQ